MVSEVNSQLCKHGEHAFIRVNGVIPLHHILDLGTGGTHVTVEGYNWFSESLRLWSCA